MSLAARRKALGLTQEEFAEKVGVDRRTVGRWESQNHKTEPQPAQRAKIAEVLQVDFDALDVLLGSPQALPQEPEGLASSVHHGPGGTDEMIRREFLRLMAITGALTCRPMKRKRWSRPVVMAT